MEGDFFVDVCIWSGVRFNPRPRMEGDEGWVRIDDWLRVSIHAPAWRATMD